jgi:GNAT superfamily N-acetyltransferase
VTEPPAVDVRVATVDDLAAVLGILDEAAAWLWSRGIRQWPEYFESSWLLPRLEAGETWLAWTGNEAVGTFTLQWEDTAWSDHHDDDAGYVHRLAVRRSAAGLGRELLDDAAGKVRDAGRRFVRLDCMSANETLRAYYSGLGFDPRGEVVVPGATGQQLHGGGTDVTISRFELRVATCGAILSALYRADKRVF